MKQELALTIVGWRVRGTDRRTGEPFEDFIAVDTSRCDSRLCGAREAVKATYSLHGYEVQTMNELDKVQVEIDLEEQYLSAGGKAPEINAVAIMPAKDDAKPQGSEPAKAKSTLNKPKGTSARLQEYIRRHPGPDDLKQIADATDGKLTEDKVRGLFDGRTTCGMWFKYVSKALDKLEAEEGEPVGQPAGAGAPETKPVNKGVPPYFFGSGPKAENLSQTDEEKLRRKTQKALIFWVQRHGKNLRPIIRSTLNRVTEETLQRMLVDSTAFEAKHWFAVDKALKRLAIEEARRIEDASET